MSERRVRETRVAPIPEPADEPAFEEVPTDATPAAAIGFRPVVRPPMAQLIVVDDGSTTGETVRLRAAQTVIGRSEGDVLIPHDPLVSGRHLEIEREQSEDGFRWRLRDLQSTNGTFVRLARFRLRHNFEILLGRNRFRFCLPGGTPDEASEGHTESGTQGWAAVSRDELAALSSPLLMQLDGDEEIARMNLLTDQVIGSGEQSAMMIDDPLLDASHARLRQRSSGKWYIEDLDSVNGVWVRVERSHTSRHCEFQLGEQRFVLNVL